MMAQNMPLIIKPNSSLNALFMKRGKLVAGAIATALFMGISFASVAQTITTNTTTNKYVIVDLTTGQTIDIYYDTVTWRSVNRVTTMPVDYYIIRYENTDLRPDTVHGVTGLIVNDLLVKNNEGQWVFDNQKVKWDGSELRMKDKYGRKVKWENGSLKIKDWNSKYKSEKGDGAKYKEEWDKIKWKELETKVEIGTQKTKVQN
jgi:hypothetical protein